MQAALTRRGQLVLGSAQHAVHGGYLEHVQERADDSVLARGYVADVLVRRHARVFLAQREVRAQLRGRERRLVLEHLDVAVGRRQRLVRVGADGAADDLLDTQAVPVWLGQQHAAHVQGRDAFRRGLRDHEDAADVAVQVRSGTARALRYRAQLLGDAGRHDVPLAVEDPQDDLRALAVLGEDRVPAAIVARIQDALGVVNLPATRGGGRLTHAQLREAGGVQGEPEDAEALHGPELRVDQHGAGRLGHVREHLIELGRVSAESLLGRGEDLAGLLAQGVHGGGQLGVVALLDERGTLGRSGGGGLGCSAGRARRAGRLLRCGVGCGDERALLLADGGLGGDNLLSDVHRERALDGRREREVAGHAAERLVNGDAAAARQQAAAGSWATASGAASARLFQRPLHAAQLKIHGELVLAERHLAAHARQLNGKVGFADGAQIGR